MPEKVRQNPSERSHFLTTRRLAFRHWAENDLKLAIGLWGDPKVTKLIDERGKLNKTQVKELLDREIQNQQAYGVQYWPIFLLKTGEHVGACGLRPKDPPDRVFELGFHIRPKFWRRGFATEAAKAVIGYAFIDLGAATLFAGHNPANTASRDLLLKLGFRRIVDELYPPTGLMHPSYLLAKKKRAMTGNNGQSGETSGRAGPRTTEGRQRPQATFGRFGLEDRPRSAFGGREDRPRAGLQRSGKKI